MRAKIEARVSDAEKELFIRQAAQENLNESVLLRKILREYLDLKERQPEKKELNFVPDNSNEKVRKEQEIKFRVSNEE